MSHVLLFTGHMIDKPDRVSPRFPSAKEAAAGAAIRQVLRKTLESSGSKGLLGIAAAACGGDILFHEGCRELHIPSELYLGIPVEAFSQTSVSSCGADWEVRYRRLVRELPVHILFPAATADAGSDVWEKANQWMLDTALAGGDGMTLIALWDGKKGDGPGGAEHMVQVAKEQHGIVEIIDVLGL